MECAALSGFCMRKNGYEARLRGFETKAAPSRRTPKLARFHPGNTTLEMGAHIVDCVVMHISMAG